MDSQQAFNPLLYSSNMDPVPIEPEPKAVAVAHNYEKVGASRERSASKGERVVTISSNDASDSTFSPRGDTLQVTRNMRERSGSKFKVIDIEAGNRDEDETTLSHRRMNSMLMKILQDKQKNNVINVTEYSDKGETKTHTFTSRAFLRLLLKETEDKISPTSSSSSSSSSSLNSKGSISNTSSSAISELTNPNQNNEHDSKKTVKKSLFTIKNRDLRRLEYQYNEVGDPTIFVRRHCVLFSIDPIRAIILHNKVYVLLERGGGDSAQELFRRNLNEWGELGISFEAKAYEAILKTALHISGENQNRVSDDIEKILNVFKVASVIPIEDQEEMREMKDKISSLIAKSSAQKNVLEAVLEDEEDLALLNLTVLYQKPSLYTLPLSKDILVFHEEMEVLLETYLMEFNSIESKFIVLQQKLKSAEESVSLRLDTSRNQLLIADTSVSVISLCIGMGSYIGSIMGMNLKNGQEDVQSTFNWVTCVTTTGIAVLACVILLVFKYQGIIPSELTSIQKYKGRYKSK